MKLYAPNLDLDKASAIRIVAAIEGVTFDL